MNDPRRNEGVWRLLCGASKEGPRLCGIGPETQRAKMAAVWRQLRRIEKPQSQLEGELILVQGAARQILRCDKGVSLE